MSKITLNSLTSGFNSQAALNTNFASIEDEFQDKVLYRDNPNGEPNQMECNLDMNGFYILNAANLPSNGSIVEMVIPQDFGAKGDGLTDDTQAFKDALAYIKNRIGIFNWGESITSSLVVNNPVFVEFNGNNRQYKISEQLWISDGFAGLVMRNFSLIAADNFTTSTGVLTFNNDTGYIGLSGVAKSMLRLGKSSKLSHRGNIFENIAIDCKLKCDGIYSQNTSFNSFKDIQVYHGKRYGMRFYGNGSNSGARLNDIRAFQYLFSEAPNYEFDGVGIAIESADIMSENITCAHNKVGMYFSTYGNHTLGKNHNYAYYPDINDPAVFPVISNITDSSVTNSSVTGTKMRVTTTADHSLTAGSVVYSGWYNGISNNGGVSGKWTPITIINSTTFDMDNTTFAGAYIKPFDTVTFTGGGSSNIVYTDQDNASIGATITFSTTGSLPSEIVVGNKYIVKTVSAGANTFTITEGSLGAATKTFATTGSGVHTVNWSYKNLVRTQEKEPISMWLSPSVVNFRAMGTQLDGVVIRNYSRSPQFIGIVAGASGSRQRTGYPWFDHRVLTANDNLDGLMISNVTVFGGMAQMSFYEQGSGSIVEPTKCIITNLLKKSGNTADTRGYQEIIFTTNITNNSPTGYTSAKTGSIVVDDTTVSLSVATSVDTILKLINYVESAVQLSGAGITVDGYVNTSSKKLRFISQSYGDSSKIQLSGNIFTSLTDFSSLDNTVKGVSNQITFNRMPELTQLIARQGDKDSPSITFTSIRANADGEAASIDTGTGIFSDFDEEVAFANNSVETMRLDGFNNVVVGDGRVDKTATNGYLYLPEVSLTASGAPTGIPTAYTGRVPMVVGTNDRLYMYVNGSWKYATLT